MSPQIGLLAQEASQTHSKPGRNGIARPTQQIPRTRNRSSNSHNLESPLSQLPKSQTSLLRWPLKALSVFFHEFDFCLAAEFAGFVSRAGS